MGRDGVVFEKPVSLAWRGIGCKINELTLGQFHGILQTGIKIYFVGYPQ
jgi:hypothetical protein